MHQEFVEFKKRFPKKVYIANKGKFFEYLRSADRAVYIQSASKSPHENFSVMNVRWNQAAEQDIFIIHARNCQIGEYSVNIQQKCF